MIETRKGNRLNSVPSHCEITITQMKQHNRILIVLLVSVTILVLMYTSAISQPTNSQDVAFMPQGAVQRRVDVSVPSINDPDLTPGYKKRLPQCIIAGVRKAGTRALINFLSIHPDIVTAKSESHFFDLSWKYRKGVEYFRKKMPKSNLSQITIEKTPRYFFYLPAIKRIKQMNDTIKILLIMREPVARAVSEYIQFDYLKGHKKPFEHYAMKSNGKVSRSYLTLRHSIYYSYARYWLKVFPRDQIHFVNGDTLTKMPVTELKKIESFLGLKHFISEDNFFFHKKKGFFCWRSWDKSEHCLSDSKGRPHPEIDKSVRRKLSDYFRPYNRQFFDLIGDDFGWST